MKNLIHEKLLDLVKQERKLISQILDLLQAVQDQKLHLEWGYGNLFEYLVRGLGYSESLAYQRKAALKICAELPEVKEKLDQGTLSLTTLARANKILNTKTVFEKRELILELENKSTKEVDKILARTNITQTFPGPAKSRVINKKAQRYIDASTIRISLDFTEEEFQNLERLKALKSHQVTDMKELINLLVNRELEKYNNVSNTSSKSKNPRQIKVSVKNYLLQKANYKCQYPGCNQTHFLQVDHKKSVSKGGTNHIQNLQVLCQAHNQFKYLKHG